MTPAPFSSLSFLYSDRRVWLFALVAALAVVLVRRLVAEPEPQSDR